MSSMRFAEATKCSGQSLKNRLNIVALIFEFVLLFIDQNVVAMKLELGGL